MSYIPKKRNQILWERFFKKIFFKIFLPVAVVFIASMFFINAGFFSIKNIGVVGNKNTPTENIEKIFQETIAGKYGGIYNKSNFLLYPETQIEQNILQQEKRVKDIKISYKGVRGDIEISVTEKIPAFLYTNTKDDTVYFVESNGNIFTEFAQSETETLKKDFIILSDASEKNQIQQEQFLEKNIFEKVIALVEKLENIDIAVKEIVDNGYGELVFILSNNSKIVFLEDQDFDKIPETLKKISVKKDLKINKEEKSFLDTVKYVNISHGENIFYCLAGEVCENNY